MKKIETSSLEPLTKKCSGIPNSKKEYWNLTPSELMEFIIQNGEGQLCASGAIMCDTGRFTGRSPKDRYIVKDGMTDDQVWWGEINLPIEEVCFDLLYESMLNHLAGRELFIREAYAGADEKHRLSLKVINTLAWHNMFCYNMFIRPDEDELKTFESDFTIINCPDFNANPKIHGTRQENFSVINFSKKIILIGGTGYSGEMKKGMFSVLNFLLPTAYDVFPMHCSANVSQEGLDTAIFFGLSGTGKTTLSADPNRLLIGDDEHGWTKDGVFNFEGGCYAKTMNLTQDKEPFIYEAIRFGAILENTRFLKGQRDVDYSNIEITENTRVSYPLHQIKNVLESSIGGVPKNIFFLTCDAFGVMPPIQLLSKGQAMYHFISGYTSKVAGTEDGINEPMPVFSACFGAPFMPLHPTFYAEQLGRKLEDNDIKVWLINTGWVGGSYGIGSRIALKYTRAMIDAVLSGAINNTDYVDYSLMQSKIPLNVEGVPFDILNPRMSWHDEEEFNAMTNKLLNMFHQNFDQFREHANEEILAGEPVLVY